MQNTKLSITQPKMLERAKRLMPNLKTQMIPNAGHGLSIEQHEIVNEGVKTFLKK
ncbi:hypothetical protein J19TS1_35830 [Heyndrickxia oleronia]|nr:hypothetical protein J19TS1_35830 [Heyndrickxia oleronia]